jgi:7-cyano-7-deazaguanine synthase
MQNKTLQNERRAVILLSGGLDSTTCLAIAQSEGFEVYALTANYGQRHKVEIEFARRIAGQFGVRKHSIIDVDLRQFGGSALTDDIEVPKNRSLDEMEDEIPVTYVPARNTIFLSYALAWAEVLGSTDIFTGVNAVDYSGYPDCRPEYIAAFETMANLATKAGVEGQKLTIHTPLINLTKADIIKLGTDLGVDYSLTLTCYEPNQSGEACGVCDSCILRAKGFHDAGAIDPTIYQSKTAVI